MSAEELEDFITSIESKINAIQRGTNSKTELEAVYTSGRRLLNEYEQAIEKLSRLDGEESVKSHRSEYGRLIALLHQSVLSARSRLKPSSNAEFLLARRDNNIDKSKTNHTSPADSLAQDISESLRTMRKTMEGELLRAESSFGILEDSSIRMTATGRTYGMLGGVLHGSRKAIQGLWRRERTDRWLIMAALTFYVLVIAYVLARRIWWPKFLGRAVKVFLRLFWQLFLGLIRLCNPFGGQRTISGVGNNNDTRARDKGLSRSILREVNTAMRAKSESPLIYSHLDSDRQESTSTIIEADNIKEHEEI